MVEIIGFILDLLLAACSLIKIFAGSATETDTFTFWGLLVIALLDVIRRISKQAR